MPERLSTEERDQIRVNARASGLISRADAEQLLDSLAALEAERERGIEQDRVHWKTRRSLLSQNAALREALQLVLDSDPHADDDIAAMRAAARAALPPEGETHGV